MQKNFHIFLLHLFGIYEDLIHVVQFFPRNYDLSVHDLLDFDYLNFVSFCFSFYSFYFYFSSSFLAVYYHYYSLYYYLKEEGLYYNLYLL